MSRKTRNTQTTTENAPVLFGAPVVETAPLSLAPLPVDASTPAGEKALAERHPAAWASVVSVSLRATDGTPLRVVIRCHEEHTDAETQTRVRCSCLRDIASQDLFQVRRCLAHQEAALREARRTKAAAKRAAARAAR